MICFLRDLVRRTRLHCQPASEHQIRTYAAVGEAGHRFFHPDQSLKTHGHGWLMFENGVVLGAVVSRRSGYFLAFVKQESEAVQVRSRSISRAGAAVLLLNETHALRWGDRG